MRLSFLIGPVFALALVLIPSLAGRAHADTLESVLLAQDRAMLARRAHLFGDHQKGAILYYRNQLGCLQCHEPQQDKPALGPQLSAMKERATHAHVIESILEPSKTVHEGFRTEQVLLDDGRVLRGLIQSENADSLTLFVPGEEAAQVLDKQAVEARKPAASIMPAGLINPLQEEQDFYDLVCFLVELGRMGPEQSARLKPDAESIAPPPLPEYENDLDHRGLISSWNEKSFKQGERIYGQLCINCHGTREEAGSLPSALRFASERFKNGADPFSMYRTLTHGYKMMLPQRQLVPREKYDVIHYIREAYLKPFNESQYVAVDAAYLKSLPTGRLRGPAPNRSRPWSEMDYGPFLTLTYEITDAETARRPEVNDADRERARREGRPAERTWPGNTNFAYKGIAIQLDDHDGGVAAGEQFLVFEHDTLRIAGVWSGPGFIDWEGILLDGKHWRSPRTRGELWFENLPGPGWADPKTGSFDDPRERARDGQAYGPFPKDWLDFKGLYKHGRRVVLSYRVGSADVLEAYRLNQRNNDTTLTRILNVSQSPHDLAVRLGPTDALVAQLVSDKSIHLDTVGGDTVVRIPADATPIRFEVDLNRPSDESRQAAKRSAEDLSGLLSGGPACWDQTLITQPQSAGESTPFAVDTLTRPTDNPWKSRLRMSGLDFLSDGKTMVACCCDGDVWKISHYGPESDQLHWKRIASGLFHPLGIKIVDGRIFVGCRDGIYILNDLNGDGETDHYECFNHDHQVTEHFHEFAMGLQADDEGNLYYAKSARHAQDSLIPQHGTLLKVSADGKNTTILANGFRAANGVCLNPDGTFFVTDQEGHWTPMNRINRVVEGGFYGNMYSYGAPQDSSDAAMQQPLCWPNKPFDRSPSELLWVDSQRWGPLNGQLLSLSYGYGKVFVVPHELVRGSWQGGMCRLPLPRFDTGIMRGRFNPHDGHLYVCGMQAWGSSQTERPGGLYRIRPTGIAMNLPVGFHAHHDGITLEFSDPVAIESASNPGNYLVETWDLKRTANYGSGRYNERTLDIQSVHVSPDGKRVELKIDSLQPTWTVQIAYKLYDASGTPFGRVLQGTIHQLD